MKDWLLMLRNVVIALVVIFIGQLLPPMLALEQWIEPQRVSLAWLTGIIAGSGWAFLMGAAIYRIIKGGQALNRREIKESVKSVKDFLELPYTSRVSKYVVPKKAVGGGFSDEVSIGQFKSAWKEGLWKHDHRWRGIFIMAFGALFMFVGGFGLIIVLSPPGLKFLAGLVFLYAAFKLIGAFRK